MRFVAGIAADANSAGAGVDADADTEALELANDGLGENSTPCNPPSPVGLGAGLGLLRKSPHK